MSKRINFVVPGVSAHTFSGGLLCVFEYANQLADLGHRVSVSCLLPSEPPMWFVPRFELIFCHQSVKLTELAGSAREVLLHLTKRSAGRASLQRVLPKLSRVAGYQYVKALMIDNFSVNSITADYTIATSFETSYAVAAYGSGQKFYFAQHYEPYFALDSDNPAVARIDAELSYNLDAKIITNSTWLKGKIESERNVSVLGVNTNAIDHRTFFVEAGIPKNSEFTVSSYGGRNASWKGFADAAEAMKLVRKVIPGMKWEVFGDALLAPDNMVAAFAPLGFLKGDELRRAYNRSHVTLCPSWYESFPLFPLEAMACGSAVVTTPIGTEDYATNNVNSLVVAPRDPRSMADAILRLHEDQSLRERLVHNALDTAGTFTWPTASRAFLRLLEKGDDALA